MYTYIEVEANANSLMAANQAFKNLSEPFKVSQVRIFEGQPEGRLYSVTGWSSSGGGTAVDAHAVQVEDSGSGAAYLVYGGDWGIRLRPVHSEQDWGAQEPDQLGETHLVLADLGDIIAAGD